MNETTRDHVIAATHLVLGPSNFLILRLPEQWDVRIGRNPFEVDYTTEFAETRWAAQGQATALLVNAAARCAVELDIRTAKASLRARPFTPVQQGPCRVGGHAATFSMGEIPIGLTRRKRLPVLNVSFRCPETSRHVELVFTGRLGPVELQSLVPPLERTRCH